MLQPSRSIRNPKFEYGSGPGPLLFQNGPKAYLSRFGLGAGGQHAATEQINSKPKSIGVALDLDPYFSKVVPKLKIPSRALGAGGQNAAIVQIN